MTTTITATPDTTNAPPRVALVVSGFSGPTTVTITRIDSAGNAVPVRSANPATLTSGGWVGWDYEAPHGQAVTYYASATWFSGSLHSAAVQASTTLPVTQPWLIHPGIPALSQPLLVAAMGDVTRDVNQGVHRPLGRRSPIIITDGQRQAETFDLTVRTASDAQEGALLALLDDASVLLLQIAYGAGYSVTRSMYRWVAVGTLVASRLVPTWQTGAGDAVNWTLPLTVASRPSGLLQSQRTWADVVAEDAAWADAIAGYATWRDLILDNPSTATGAATAGETWADNGDGTLTVTGATDNGDGTVLIVENDNGDGTVTVG